MISADLLALLRCPQTHQPLTQAEPELLARVNEAISRIGDGLPANGILDAALVREDRTAAYPVLDGIPVLLAERAILL